MLALFACACQTGGGGSGGGDELSDAKATTHRFFDALGKGDCGTLGELVPAASGSAACAKFIHEWREELKLALVDIPDVRRDGRDPRAIIVTTTVMRRDKQETLQLRMTHDGGVWHLAL
jgi:hypothetical protein